MALRIATGCTSDTNIQHLHNETNILPLNAHLKLHSSQLRQKSQHTTHPLHKFTVLTENERHKKQTIFDNNNNYTVNINTKSDLICEDLIQSNLKLIHSHIVSNHLSQRPNKVLQDQTPSVSPAELLLSRETRRKLAQLRTNKSPLLVSYLYSIGDPRHPSPLCPLCLMHDHTSHLFECKSIPTSISSLDLWTNPDKVEPFLATWGGETVGCHMIRVLDSAGSTLVEWGRQQQQQRFKPRLHQYVVSLSKTLNPHCFSRLSCEMSTRQKHAREGCLLSAVSSLEKIALKNQHIYWLMVVTCQLHQLTTFFC